MMRKSLPSPRIARRGLAVALVFAVLFVAPTPVQAAWQAMFLKVLAQIKGGRCSGWMSEPRRRGSIRSTGSLKWAKSSWI